MKKIILLLSCFAFTGSIMAGEMNTKQTMKEMKVQFLHSIRAKDLTQLNTSLEKLDQLVAKAKQLDFPDNKKALFLEGLNKVATVIDKAQSQAENGQMQQSQQTLKQVDMLREEYHQQRKESIWKRLLG